MFNIVHNQIILKTIGIGICYIFIFDLQ
jgi:hypothetical protein